MSRDLVIDLRSISRRFGGSGDPVAEEGRLGAFLADPALLRSLREDDHRRKRLVLILLSLLTGLLVGAGGVLLALRPWRPLAGGERTARLLATQSQTLWRAKEIDSAVSQARLAVELAPELVDTWDALSLALFYGGQTEEAEAAARRCLKINPGYTRAYHMLGDISFYTGGWKQAEAYWKKAKAHRALPRLLLLEGRFDEAAPQVARLLRDRPDDPFLHGMAEAVRLRRLTPEMRRQLAPDFVASRDAETAEGWRLFYGRRYEEAEAAFDRTISRSPRDGSALIGRAWCLLRLGSPGEAHSAFQQVLASWPTSYSALNGLAWSRKALGRPEGATALWREMAEGASPTEQMEIPSCLKGLGSVAFERGDLQRASDYLSRSLLGDPFDPETRELLQNVLKKLPPP